ncbi:protein kinase [Streptomyces sp. NPDC020965]|uniref:serine/threonine-protein kinase n=1 Tax=Streptomyces sp. NPDC020965 TaxID=3365105 RepID=UPI0037AE90E6
MENSPSTDVGLLIAGRYRLAESIGRGGMGRVWRAHDEVLHRVVAIKELTAGMYASGADRAVFHTRTRTEARAAARISHPGVVTVHDVLDHDDRPWIVMQYVDGPSLADATGRAGRIPAPETARIGLQLLRALDAAHLAGVLHRDIKPANVLLTQDGRALITDFGIASIEGDPTLTRTGEIIGSVDYLAPERVQGADPGPASDLWSLGATLYTAVEGVSPFRRSSPLTTLQAVMAEEPAPPVHAGPLAPVITALLCKDPAGRPSTARIEEMLQEVVEGRAPAPYAVPGPTERIEPPPPHQPPPPASGGSEDGGVKRFGRMRMAAVVTALSVVAGVGAGYAVMAYGDDEKNPATGRTTPKESGSPVAGTTPGPGTAEDPGTAKDPGTSNAPSTSNGSGQVPEGWRRVQDPKGFSLLVPDGWTRQVVNNQIDYTPDNGRHLIRIGIDPAPDFEHPYGHLQDLEGTLSKFPDYRQLRLEPNTYRDREKSAIWEFTWTERGDLAGPRRAINQVYYGDDGTEYALYMSAPVDDWAETREQFNTLLQSWRPPGDPPAPSS